MEPITIESDQPVTLQFNITAPSVSVVVNQVHPDNPEPPPPPVKGHSVPPAGLSGFDWNSAVFYKNGSIDGLREFEAWRKRKADGVAHYVTRNSWDNMKVIPGDLANYNGYRIIAMPSQPEGMDNSSTAKGDNNGFWRDQGRRLMNGGLDSPRTVIRLNWECNGTWYPWSYSRGGPGQFVAAFKNVVESVWTSAPKVKFNCNFNRDSDVAGVDPFRDILDPLVEHISLVGLDWYDHWPAQLTDTVFAQVAAHSPGGDDLAAWCRDNDKGLWLDEWGVSHWLGAGGGDNPFYVKSMFAWVQKNKDVVAGETTYNDKGAPSTLNHMLSDGSNPRARDAYLALWGG